ncbi:MAG: DUF3078 domain-containing protein [Bacteroidales bacterium]|nr:DUF3078 domain-containing protein [Bacteroidales bacterium]
MKKLSLLILILFGTVLGLQCQTKTDSTKLWKINGKASLNFNENYFSNWAAGGENAYGVIGKYMMHADYQKGKIGWTNTVNLALGYSLIGNSNPMKTDDQIQIYSIYKVQWQKHWFFTILGSIQTQFANGYNYSVDSSTSISGFLAPLTIDLGPGIQYKPNKFLEINFSPVTPRIVYVNNQRLADEGSFGLKPAETDSAGNIIKHASKAYFAFGARLYATLNYDIAKNVNLNTKLSLFSDYLDNPQNIDVDWQVLLGMKVNSWLNVDISTQMLYNNKVLIANNEGIKAPRLQFKQLLMVGIGYTF